MECAEAVLAQRRRRPDRGALTCARSSSRSGKIGLPIAAQLARKGHEVVGCDIDPRVVDTVNAGRAPFPGEAGLDELLAEVVPAGRLRATTDTAAAVADGAELVIAVPPLVVDARGAAGLGHPRRRDRRHRPRAGRREHAGRGQHRDDACPVGTTRGRIAPALAARSGRASAARTSPSCSAPSASSPGAIFADLATYPKLVGGLTREGEARGVAAYEAFLDAEVRGMGSAEAAELTKLVETTYRDVNIALANEFARHADALGVDLAPGDRRRELPAVQPRPPARGRRRRPLHPGLPALLPCR